VGALARARCDWESGNRPNNTDARSTWLWGDGSLPAIIQTITNGVPHPKEYRGVMPPMGGAQLSPSEVSAVAAYVWALSHQRGRYVLSPIVMGVGRARVTCRGALLQGEGTPGTRDVFT
jgi:hypothetical protein